MQRLRSVFIVLSLIAGATVFLGSAPPAQAVPLAAAFNGGGAITPPIQLTDVAGPSRSIALGGTLTGVLGTVPGTASCGFNGTGNDGIAVGTGGLAGTCNGANLAVNCNLTYARVGIHAEVVGSCSGNWNGTLFGVLEVVATNPPPISNITVAGVVGLGDTSGNLPTISLPPVGGGPGPSATCSSTLPLDATVEGVTVRLVADQLDPNTVEACVRVGTSTAGYGGRLVVTSPSAGGGGATVPTTDDSGTACAASDNTLPGTHPAVHVAGPPEISVDAYHNGNQTWLCAQVGTNGFRVLITTPAAPGVGLPNVAWQPDPGTP